MLELGVPSFHSLETTQTRSSASWTVVVWTGFHERNDFHLGSGAWGVRIDLHDLMIVWPRSYVVLSST